VLLCGMGELRVVSVNRFVELYILFVLMRKEKGKGKGREGKFPAVLGTFMSLSVRLNQNCPK
jgi:hypothetical protein